MRPDEQLERLLEHIPLEGLETDPEQPRALFISNVIRRVFVTMFATYGDDLTRLAATVDGELTVSDANVLEALLILAGYLDTVEALLAATLTVSADAQIPDKWDGTTGTAGDAFGGYVAFGFTSKVVTVIAVTHPLIIQLKDGGGAAGDEIYIPGDVGISLDLKTTEYRVKNGSGGNNSVYTVVATGLA